MSVELLTANLAKLPAKDQLFAGSLLAAAARGGLSEKQNHWVKIAAGIGPICAGSFGL
jgi:hypothetical protein